MDISNSLLIPNIVNLTKTYDALVTITIYDQAIAISLDSPEYPPIVLQYDRPQDVRAEHLNLRRFIAPPGARIEYREDGSRDAGPRTVPTWDQNAFQREEQPGDIYQCHLAEIPGITPAFYAAMADGTPLNLSSPNQAQLGYSTTADMQPKSVVEHHPLTYIAVFSQPPDLNDYPRLAQELEQQAVIAACNAINELRGQSPGYVWPNAYLQRLQQQACPHGAPSNPHSPYEVALSQLPPPATVVATDDPRQPGRAVHMLTNDVWHTFSETQAPIFAHYLRERAQRSISFPWPPHLHTPAIGFVAANVVELDDARTVYYTRNILDPADAAPHRPSCRTVKSINLNFTIHHPTPDRNEPVSIQSPIYLDQSPRCTTLLIAEGARLAPSLVEHFLQGVHPPDPTFAQTRHVAETTPADLFRNFLHNAALNGAQPALHQLLQDASQGLAVSASAVSPSEKPERYSYEDDRCIITVSYTPKFSPANATISTNP